MLQGIIVLESWAYTLKQFILYGYIIRTHNISIIWFSWGKDNK